MKLFLISVLALSLATNLAGQTPSTPEQDDGEQFAAMKEERKMAVK